MELNTEKEMKSEQAVLPNPCLEEEEEEEEAEESFFKLGCKVAFHVTQFGIYFRRKISRTNDMVVNVAQKDCIGNQFL
jgi:hypothetical protein